MIKKTNPSVDNKPIKASFIYIGCSFLQKVFSIITIPVFTRIMTTEHYGIYSVYNSWLIVLSVFVSLNFGWDGVLNGFRDFKEKKEEMMNSVQFMALIIAAVYLILTIIFPGPISSFFTIDILYVRLMLIQTGVSCSYDMWCAKQRYEFRYKSFCTVTLIYTIVPVALSLISILLLRNTNTAVNRACVNSLTSFVIAFVLFLTIFKNANGKVKLKYWKYALTLNLPLVPHYLCRTLMNQLDHIMINKIDGSSNAAIYSLAYSIGLLPNMLTLALNNALLPWIHRMIETNNVPRIKKVTNSIACILSFGIVLLMLLAPEIVRIFGPESYQSTIYVIPMIAASTFAIYIYTVLSDIEIYYSATRYIMIGSIIATVFNAVSNYIFISKYGYIAAGYTTLASFFIILIMYYIQYRTITRDNRTHYIDNRFLLILMGLVTITALVSPLVYRNIIARYAIIIFILIVLLLFRKHIIAYLKDAIKEYKL
ncbi:MAG: oligosaccharide flippase family protein [Ruminococcus flavefaciens]